MTDDKEKLMQTNLGKYIMKPQQCEKCNYEKNLDKGIWIVITSSLKDMNGNNTVNEA